MGTLTKEEADKLWAAGWKSLRDVGVEQDEYQGGEEPTRRFLELLRAVIASGRAHLADSKYGDKPTDPGLLGWRERTIGVGENERTEWEPRGERIGWIDGDDVLLEPDAAFAVIQRLGREQGNGLAITQHTLWKRMAEKGLLASREKGRNHQRREIMGRRTRIIHISPETLWARKRDNRDNRDNQEQIR